MIMGMVKRSALRCAFDYFAPIIPAAKRKVNEIDAQDCFEFAQRQTTYRSRTEAFGSVKAHLKAAAGDCESDKPYIEILGLKGGKAEFSSLVMKGIK